MPATVTAAAEKLRRDTARRYGVPLSSGTATVGPTQIDNHGPDEPFHPWKLALAILALLVLGVMMVPVALVLTFASCFVVLVHGLVRWARR